MQWTFLDEQSTKQVHDDGKCMGHQCSVICQSLDHIIAEYGHNILLIQCLLHGFICCHCGLCLGQLLLFAYSLFAHYNQIGIVNFEGIGENWCHNILHEAYQMEGMSICWILAQQFDYFEEAKTAPMERKFLEML